MFAYTLIPNELEPKPGFLQNSVRPVIIKVGETWTRRRQEGLLSSAIEQKLEKDLIGGEKNKAFDLLDYFPIRNVAF